MKSTVGRLADRMLSIFVPRATAAAASTMGCTNYFWCQACGSSLKSCWSQYCDGQYVNGKCGTCGWC
ncbi:hypothetical protein [Allorhizocola rhizosphaerae]|uniref:hypothetical protein n=1 Tax=Allorhizocola rhizosphaerae TaxID=1872709 RepID=UPI000E3D8215|nr:hypothetical protein [Allorhizocola rhizosphaerae]